MEGIGVFLDEEWESLSKLFSCDQEDSNNLLQHLKGSALFPNQAKQIYQSSSGVYNSHHDLTTNTFESMDFYTVGYESNNATMPVFSDDVMEEILQLKAELCKDQLSNAPLETSDSREEMQLKRKYETSGIQTHQDNSDQDNLSESPKKKPRVSRDTNKRNAQSKKNKKADQISSNEEENSSGGIVNSSSTNSNSEDDSINASEELNSKGKARASRGSATDPQSLYARRRRERINERLKILQNLVPNGTKVDISTMLEEAVHYVKFLQLQIKLLSSDDMWMYAPIAYNGMDIGLYQKIVPNMWTQH